MQNLVAIFPNKFGPEAQFISGYSEQTLHADTHIFMLGAWSTAIYVPIPWRVTTSHLLAVGMEGVNPENFPFTQMYCYAKFGRCE